MGIDMRWEDENGKELETIPSPSRSQFAALIPDHNIKDNVKEFPCLCYIDPYGDTVFNRLQMPQLIADLERIILHCSVEETKQHVEAILGVVRRASHEVHTYIKFIGD